jgi:O-antigen/teichoic acid export membrane protein
MRRATSRRGLGKQAPGEDRVAGSSGDETPTADPLSGGSVVPSWARLWARDASLLVITQGLTMVATSASAILIARHLRPGQWGVFSAFLGVSVGLGAIGEFGLVVWSLRELSRLFADRGASAEPQARTLITAALAITIAASAAILVCAVSFTTLNGDGAAVVLTLAALMIYAGLFSAANILESYLRARRMIGRVVRASLLEKLTLITLIILSTVVLNAGIAGVGIAYVIAGLVRISLLVRPVFPHLGDVTKPAFGDVKAVGRGSFPFALTASAGVISKLDPFWLLMFSATAAGYFSLGDRVVTPAIVLPSILSATLFPFLAGGEHRLGAILRVSVVLGLGGAAVTLLGVALAPRLVPLFFGQRYVHAVPAVRVLLCTVPIIFAASPLLAYGYSRGRERPIFVLSLFSALAGTVFIVIGQALGGVTVAAGGSVLRQALLLCGLAVVATRAGKAHDTELEAGSPELAGSPSPGAAVL